MSDKVLCDNSRIVGIWSALRLKELGLEAFNRMVYWEID